MAHTLDIDFNDGVLYEIINFFFVFFPRKDDKQIDLIFPDYEADEHRAVFCHKQLVELLGYVAPHAPDTSRPPLEAFDQLDRRYVVDTGH